MTGKLLNTICTLALGSLLGMAVSACENPEVASNNKIAKERIWKGEKAHIVRYPWQEKLDAQQIGKSEENLQRVLFMTNEERGHRLPSFIMSNKIEILLNQGPRRQLQNADCTFHSDSKGNFHFSQKIGRDDVEYFLVDSDLFVRYTNGPFRSKPTLNQPVDMLRELSAKDLEQSFGPWLAYLNLTNGELSSYEGRTVYKYLFTLKPTDAAKKPVPPADSNSDEVDWRKYAWPTDIKGSLVIDSESAVVVAAHLEVKADIIDSSFAPTTMQYTFDHELTSILKAEEVKAPEKSVEEFTVQKYFRGGKYRQQNGPQPQQSDDD